MTAYDWPARPVTPDPTTAGRERDVRSDAGRGTCCPIRSRTAGPPPARAVGARRAERGGRPLAADRTLRGDRQRRDRHPRVTGRIRDVWVEPMEGLRAYAAAANGGVWYTDDGGTRWRALGGWRPADLNASLFAATRSPPAACGRVPHRGRGRPDQGRRLGRHG